MTFSPSALFKRKDPPLSSPPFRRDRVDPRFLKFSGVEAYTGNELIVKGALEAGVGLVTGYPGSPVSDVFEVLSAVSPYLSEKGVVAQIANNEALAAARLNGARQAGLRAMAVMKSVGMHVAADGLAIGNLMETRHREGGAVCVVGDDPWNETTQINSDSRYLSKHLHMPLLEPATFQELKDWISAAFDLSGASDLYLTYLLTTNQVDGGGAVKVGPHPELPLSARAKTMLSSADVKISDTVLIPPHTSWREATLKERMSRLLQRVRELNLNKSLGPKRVRMPVGFISAGLSYSYLEEVLRMIGLWDRTPVLKLGMIYPLDAEAVLSLANHVEHLVVVEEKRGFIEEQVAEILVQLKQDGRLPKPPALWGKKFPNNEPGFPAARGLNVSVVLEVLGPAFLKWKEYFPTLQVDQIEKELEEMHHTQSDSYDVPPRTPTFCPGCPHRDSAAVCLSMKNKFMEALPSTDLIFHGESGCHSMLQFAPFEGLMQNYSGMGLGGGTGAGMSPFVANQQVVFLGDSTFFHSGLIAISDAIKNNQNITFIILDNKTTAMTGHQPTPGNPVDLMGRPTAMQDIESVVRGMIPEGVFLRRANPGDRTSYQRLVEEAVLQPGVKVIIADKECAITLHRRLNLEKKRILQKKGFLNREEIISVVPEACEYCLRCTTETGCPGLTIEETPYGRKIRTDLSTCVNDGACARVKACPSFEKITIKRVAPPQKKEELEIDEARLPVPATEMKSPRWSAYTAAVGGMGAGIVNAVLVRAAMKQGYEVSFLDKKGLAIRNGGVYGHLVFSKRGPVFSPVIPYGKADLLIGIDLLEAARALDAKLNLRVAHPVRTHAIVNTHKNETVLSLMGRGDFDPQKLETVITAKIRPEGYFSFDFSHVSEKYCGSKLYANMVILGAAYQKGWIPLSQENIFAAVRESVRPEDVEVNFRAFSIGRSVAVTPEFLRPTFRYETLAEVVEKNSGYLARTSLLFGARWAREYRNLMDQVHRWIDLPRESGVLMARTVYDLLRYGGAKLAHAYVVRVWNTYRKDQERFGFRATSAVIANLYKCMAIKDEIWVAQLLVSPEKYERDRERYKIDFSNGDKVTYLHFNRPRFTVFGMNLEFDVNTSDWMLYLMASAKFLRVLLPGWHRKEKEFRDWYISLVDRFMYFQSPEDYHHFVDALTVVEKVRGYRETRFAANEEAQRSAGAFLSQIKGFSPVPSEAGVPVKSV
ncbi:MAG: 2-oxoacid:acceptor oxidoreductase family protein [Elusimicrobia bacterium]|nr:2-oxoacid:acceptor oxidoreductase family protein [Candidatus Obscuribacterium magneticum]